MINEEIIEDKDEWNSIIEQFQDNDIYFLKDYFIPFHIFLKVVMVRLHILL